MTHQGTKLLMNSLPILKVFTNEWYNFWGLDIYCVYCVRKLGHSKISITLDVYGHLIPEMQNEAAELIDDLITPIPVELHTGCTRNDISPIDNPHIKKIWDYFYK